MIPAAGGRRAISRISSFVVGVRGGAEAADDGYDDESSDEEATLAELLKESAAVMSER